MKQYSLLLVDDLETNLTILGNLFKKEGYKLFKAVNGDEALEKTRSELPDLILLDVMMPKKDGFQVCKELKADPKTLHIPIIFLTGRDDKEDKVSGFDLGAVDYITKPFDFREVRARVHSQLLIKKMSDELKEERDKLSKTNQFIQLILNSIPTSICVIDDQKRILNINETFEQVFKLSRDKVMGKNVYEIFNGQTMTDTGDKIELPDSSEQSIIEKCLKDINEVKGIELRMMIGREEKTFLFHFRKLIEEQFLIDLVEISDRKKMENELVQQSRLRYIGEVVIGVAHEINNPNTFVRVNNKNIEMILGLMRPVFDKIQEIDPQMKIGNLALEDAYDRLEKANQGIFQASERILMVVERLKDFAKRDSLGMETLNLSDIINDAVVLTTYFSEKILDTQVILEDDLPAIKGTSIELVQLFANLITNSFHAIEEKISNSNGTFKRGNISISAKYEKSTEEIVVLVVDDGIGIPLKIQEKIFNPFFTTKPQGKGTGLGLSLCYGIVKRHKGDISFLSIPDQKTEFTIKIPIEHNK